MANEVYGASALVHIKFDGVLSDLADILASAFNLETIEVAASEIEPYDEVGSGEALGWEFWLCAVPGVKGVFSFRIETEHSVDELFHGRMHDLSPWLARYLTMMCQLAVEPMRYG